MRETETPVDHPVAPCFADWMSLLHGRVSQLSRSAAKRHHVADYADDLAQETLQRLWIAWQHSDRRPTEQDARRVLSQLASTEKKQRARQRRALHGYAHQLNVERRDQSFAVNPVGIPTLCPHLVAFGRNAVGAKDLPQRLLVAALAVAPETLSVAQLGTFALAYVNRYPAVRIAPLLGATPLGVTRRLQRISCKLEKVLTQYLVPNLSGAAKADVLEIVLTGPARGKSRIVPTCDSSTLCDELLRALDELLHDKVGKYVPLTS